MATVTKNIYTDMTRLKIPTASAPILLETYKLKTMPIALIIKPVDVKISPFIKNIFVFFKISPLNRYFN